MSDLLKIKVGIAAALVFVAFIVLLSLNPFVTIGAGERGVVLAFGAARDTELQPGLHFRKPIIEDVVKVDAQTQKTERETIGYSKDLQQVTVGLALNYAIIPSEVVPLYKEIGLSFEEKIIAPAIEESVKQAVAKFTAEELISKREEVKMEIKNSLRSRLTASHLITQEFSITNFEFSGDYEKAVEAKQVAEQRAKEQINITKQEEEKKKQEILKAEALAEKTRLEATALANQANAANLVNKLDAEARLEAAKRWDGKLPTTMVPGGAVPFLSISY